MKKSLITLVLVAGAALLVWAGWALFGPDRFEPVAWQPTPEHALSIETRPMGEITRLAEPVGTGPETVIQGPDGDALYAGYADGTVHRLVVGPGDEIVADRIVAETNGRPLGLAFAPPTRGRQARPTLYIADAERGLLAVDDTGTIRVLSDSADGTAFRFTDDVTVATDGRIYFTDASSRWSQPEYQSAILEHAGDGRLLMYDPATGQTQVLLSGLEFANGVALSSDGRYLLVNETGAYRVRRYELAGPNAGTSRIVIGGLPGFPDGLSRAAGQVPGPDLFWIALFAPRDALLDFAADKPFLRELTWHLPGFLQPGPAHVAHVMAIDGEGQPRIDLVDDSDTAYAPITSVADTGAMLYFGSLDASAIGRRPAPGRP